MNLSVSRIRHIVRRFEQINIGRATLDFQTADLAREIRDALPAGPSGDLQARQWFVEHLGVSASTAIMLLCAAKAFRLFPDINEWVNYSGWAGIGYMTRLTSADRKRLRKALREKVKESGRPLSYDAVRYIALDLGARPDRKFGGRPTQTELEKRVETLTRFIRNRFNSSELPERVRRAMTRSKLSRLARAVSE